MNASVIRPGDCVLSPRVSTALPLLVPSRGLLRQQRHRVAVLQQIRQRLHSVRASSLKDSEPEVLRQVDEHPPHIEVERLQPVRGGEQQERDGSEILTEEGKGDILDQANDGVSELPTTRDRIDEGVALRENVEEDLSVAVQGTVVATVSLLGVLGVFGAVGIFFKDQINDILSQFADLIEAYGPAGYVIFVLTYAGLEVLALPAIPLTMSAGFLFGPLYGTILVSIAGTLAATGAFLIARYLARDRVLKLAQGNKKFLAIDKAIGEDGFGCLGMLPGTWAYVSAGALGRAFIRQESEELFPGGPGQLWTLGIGLVATVLAASYVTRIAKDAVKDLE